MVLPGRVCTEQPTTWRPVCLHPQHSPTMDLTETSGTRHIIEGLGDKGNGRRLVCGHHRGERGGGVNTQRWAQNRYFVTPYRYSLVIL
jgi:hypothetical protein